MSFTGLIFFGNSVSVCGQHNGKGLQNQLAVEQEAAFMYITARMASGSHDFTNRVKGHYYIQVNDTYMGSIETDGVTEVTGFGLFTDELNTGSNTIVRSYDTNPGSHRVVAETEINTYVPEDAVLSFIGSADEYMDITPHPDFAVYPENIYVSDFWDMRREPSKLTKRVKRK